MKEIYSKLREEHVQLLRTVSLILLIYVIDNLVFFVSGIRLSEIVQYK